MPIITFNVSPQNYQRLGKSFGDGYQSIINDPVSGNIPNPQPLSAFAESQLRTYIADFVILWETQQAQRATFKIYNDAINNYSVTSISIS